MVARNTSVYRRYQSSVQCTSSRHSFWRRLFLLLVVCCATQPHTALAEVLELEAAQQLALSDNPGLAEMRARYAALTEAVPQKAALPDPVVSLNAMNLPWDDFDRNQENMTQLQIGISQVFPFPGKLALREDIAVSEADMASHSVDEMRFSLRKNVAVTWWELFYLDSSLKTVRQNQSLLRQLVEVASKKYQVGNGLQQDVLLAQLELSKLLDREIQIRAMREHRALRLNLLMGRDPPTRRLNYHSQQTIRTQNYPVKRCSTRKRRRVGRH